MPSIWVTGVGAVTPLGHSWPETWSALLAGASGVGPITLFDAGPFPVKVAAEVKSWDPAMLGRRDARHLDRSVQFALCAAREAICRAGLGPPSEPERFGVVLSSATGGLTLIHEQMEALQRGGYRKVSPHLLPNMLVDSAAAQVAIEMGARGPNLAVVSACATGSDTIGEAAEIIRRGDADVILAGGTEACIVPLFMAAFCQMRGLARSDIPDPTAAKPFDRRRNGLVVGEGAAVLVLEAEEHARSRGVQPLAEIAGYGASDDAHHMAAPRPDSQGMAQAMETALRSADTKPEAVAYVSAHGTATALNDSLETRAIKMVLGDHAYRVPVSSIKGAIGHLMGASGAVEAAVCAQAIQDGTVPPTINLEEADPECDLDYVEGKARHADVSVALSNSFGMGGHNASLVFRRVVS